MINSFIRITVFVFCGQLLLFFRPKECYEKYLRLLVNLMIIMQFVIPVLGLLTGVTETELHSEFEKYDMELENVLQGMDRFQLPESDAKEREEGNLGEESFMENTEIEKIEIKSIEVRDVEIGGENTYEP